MLTLEGFNILNIKAFKAMEGCIHYTGTGLPAQYNQEMHLVLLPKGPTAQRRIWIPTDNMKTTKNAWRDCHYCILYSNRIDETRLLHSESTGTKVHTNFLLSILGFSTFAMNWSRQTYDAMPTLHERPTSRSSR